MFCTYDENDPIMQEQYQKDNFIIINNSIPRKNRRGEKCVIFISLEMVSTQPII